MSSTTKTSVSLPSGCETSSTQDTLQKDESTPETSAISSPPTLPDQGSDTSSPASEFGNTPCASPGLQMGLMFGPEAVPVSRSPLRAPSDSTTTSDTCGQPGSPSFASADLQSFLENRLRDRLAGHGSTLFSLTWKRRDIAARAPICVLLASAHRTGDNDCFGWPTTAVTKHGQRRGQLNEATFTCAWKDHGELAAQGVMTFGATSTNNTSLSVHVHPLERSKTQAAWATPTATQLGNTLENYMRMQRNATTGPRTEITDLSVQVQAARCGLVLTGSIATTLEVPDGARLSPEHSRWLLGLPAMWGDFAPTATASSRR